MTKFMENAGQFAWERLEGCTVPDDQAAAARRMVARHAVDADDEALLLAALGLS